MLELNSYLSGLTSLVERFNVSIIKRIVAYTLICLSSVGLKKFDEVYLFAQVAKIANCRKIDKLECKHYTPDKISIRDVTLGYLCNLSVKLPRIRDLD